MNSGLILHLRTELLCNLRFKGNVFKSASLFENNHRMLKIITPCYVRVFY